MKPLRDLVCVKLDPEKDKIGSIYLPYYKVQPPNTGEVISVGKKAEGQLKVGDRVQIDPFLGNPFENDGSNYVFISTEWIHGIIEPPVAVPVAP